MQVMQESFNAEKTDELRVLLPLSSFSTKAAMALVSYGADPTVQDEHGDTLLHILSSNENNKDGRNNAAINELVEMHKVNINIKNANDLTPLEQLIRGPFLTEVAMDLVRLGADPTVQDQNGNTLLHILSMSSKNNGRNNAAISELVEKHGADINIKNKKDLTPLAQLIRGKFSTEAAMALVRLGADPTVQNEHGDTLLHRLSSDENNKDGQNNAAIKELVEKYHADVNKKNANGLTPLEQLIRGKFSIEAAMTLVRLGADPTVQTEKGNTLLHILSSNNKNGQYNAEMKELVETYKVDIDKKNANGLTPLEQLMRGAFSPEEAMALVRLGADPTVQDEHGDTFLRHLVFKNQRGQNNSAIDELITNNSLNSTINNNQKVSCRELIEGYKREEQAVDYFNNKFGNKTTALFRMALGSKSIEFFSRPTSYWYNNTANSIKDILDHIEGKHSGFTGTHTKNELKNIGFTYDSNASDNDDRLLKLLLKSQQNPHTVRTDIHVGPQSEKSTYYDIQGL